MKQKPPLQPSTAADITPCGPEVIELPHEQNGKKIAIRIRPLKIAEISQAEEQPQFLAPDANGDRVRAADPDGSGRRYRNLARIGILEPTFAFSPEEEKPGLARWDDLSAGNQIAAVMEIYRISGVGQSKDVEAAKRAIGFPAEPAGAVERVDPAAPLRPPAAAAR